MQSQLLSGVFLMYHVIFQFLLSFFLELHTEISANFKIIQNIACFKLRVKLFLLFF